MLAVIGRVVLSIASMATDDVERMGWMRLMVSRLVRASPVESVIDPAVGRLARVRAMVIFRRQKRSLVKTAILGCLN